MSEKKSQIASIKWPKKLIWAIDDLCAEEHRSRNNMLMILAIEALEARGIKVDLDSE